MMGKDKGVKQVQPYDWGFSLGYGLFETIRVYDGQPFLLDEHLERLLASCRELDFRSIPSREKLGKMITSYIREHGWESRGVRLSVTYGNENQGLAPGIFLTDRAIAYDEQDDKNGVAVAISTYRKNEHSPIVQHKTFNQLENVLALKATQVVTPGIRECIFLNTAGYLAEGSKSNIFFAREGVVYTPSVDCGILPGITRALVMALLKENKVEAREGQFCEDILYRCDECFCTNALMEVLPVVRIGDELIGNGKPGKLTKYAQELYSQKVKQSIR